MNTLAPYLAEKLARNHSEHIQKMRGQRRTLRRKGRVQATQPADSILFSYADEASNPFKRAMIRAIERVSGQPLLKSMYLYNQQHPLPGESFFTAAQRLLRLHPRFDPARLAMIPRSGPLIIIANHPFGVVDGLTMGWLMEQVRPDFRIIANRVLKRAKEMSDVILPLDFSQNEDALQVNIETRSAADRWVGDGHALVVFPGGMVATAPHPMANQAIDAPWKPWAAKLVRKHNATVVPIMFLGRNSALFQVAGYVDVTLRTALAFYEVRNKIDRELAVGIGEPIPAQNLAQFGADNQGMMDHLRSVLFGLRDEALRAPWLGFPSKP